MATQTWPAAKYKITQRAFIPRAPGRDPEIIDPAHPGVDPYVIWDGKPGPHMEATDDAGHEAKSRAKDSTIDPTRSLSLVVGEEADLHARHGALKAEMAAMEERMAQMRARNQPDAAPAAAAAPPAPPAPPPAPPAAPPIRGAARPPAAPPPAG